MIALVLQQYFVRKASVISGNLLRECLKKLYFGFFILSFVIKNTQAIILNKLARFGLYLRAVRG